MADHNWKIIADISAIDVNRIDIDKKWTHRRYAQKLRGGSPVFSIAELEKMALDFTRRYE